MGSGGGPSLPLLEEALAERPVGPRALRGPWGSLQSLLRREASWEGQRPGVNIPRGEEADKEPPGAIAPSRPSSFF